MYKLRYLSLIFVVTYLIMGMNTAFAQEIEDSPPTESLVSEEVTNALDERITQLENELAYLEEVNLQLQQENEILRSSQADISLEEDTTNLEENGPSDHPVNDVYINFSENKIVTDISFPTNEEINHYEAIIRDNILPYEATQAQELTSLLKEVAEVLPLEVNNGDDNTQQLTLWHNFITLLLEYNNNIDNNLSQYEELLLELQDQDHVYLLEAPLTNFRNELSSARIAYSEAELSQAVNHLHLAKNLWQSIENDSILMNILDYHLEVALSIELLSRRYARGEDKLLYKPTPWNARQAEFNQIQEQDSSAQFIPLQCAIMAWEKASLSAENNDYDEALNFLDQSKEFITIYAGTSFSDYRVVQLNRNRRESLWIIASEIYNDGFKWTRLWEANKDIITDPNLIYPDQQLAIPEENQDINLIIPNFYEELDHLEEDTFVLDTENDLEEEFLVKNIEIELFIEEEFEEQNENEEHLINN